MNNLTIKDFYKIYADGNDSISTDKLVQMTEQGLLFINDKQMIYSLDEISKIMNKSKRSITYWIETGKLNVIDVKDNRLVTADELERLIKSTPVQKSNKCIYVKADNIEGVNKFVKEVSDKLDINKYRSRIFIDISGDEGLDGLFAYMLEKGNIEVYSNIDILKLNKYFKNIVNVTNSAIITVE